MSKPNLSGPGPDPRHTELKQVVHVPRRTGGTFLRWAFAILLVLVALAVLVLWQGAVSLAHMAQSTQAMSRSVGQGSASLERYLQQIGVALQGVWHSLGALLRALRP